MCVQCQKWEMREERVEYTRTVAGHSFTISLPARVCESCREVYYSGQKLERVGLLIGQEFYRRGESSGEAVRFLRKSLGLKARELAELLGVAPDTVSRWETGKSSPDRATVSYPALKDGACSQEVSLFQTKSCHFRPADKAEWGGRPSCGGEAPTIPSPLARLMLQGFSPSCPRRHGCVPLISETVFSPKGVPLEAVAQPDLGSTEICLYRITPSRRSQELFPSLYLLFPLGKALPPRPEGRGFRARSLMNTLGGLISGQLTGRDDTLSCLQA
jgi:putative zinc finger/helix-turn-helix YgiT family protein